MPVIPPGVTPFHIRPACTIGDDGSPTSSVLRDIQRVLHFIDDERHLTAQKLLQSVQSRLVAFEQSTVSTKQARKPSIKTGKGAFLFNKKEKTAVLEASNQENLEMEQVKDLLQSKHAVFDKLEVSYHWKSFHFDDSVFSRTCVGFPYCSIAASCSVWHSKIFPKRRTMNGSTHRSISAL
jgi:hypothetical protein